MTGYAIYELTPAHGVLIKILFLPDKLKKMHKK